MVLSDALKPYSRGAGFRAMRDLIFNRVFGINATRKAQPAAAPAAGGKKAAAGPLSRFDPGSPVAVAFNKSPALKAIVDMHRGWLWHNPLLPAADQYHATVPKNTAPDGGAKGVHVTITDVANKLVGKSSNWWRSVLYLHELNKQRVAWLDGAALFAGLRVEGRVPPAGFVGFGTGTWGQFVSFDAFTVVGAPAAEK